MIHLSKLTQPFKHSLDLQITYKSQVVTIRKVYAPGLNWLVKMLILSLLLFFMTMIVIEMVQKREPAHLISILVLCTFMTFILYPSKVPLLSRERLLINLTEKTITFRKGHKIQGQYRFDEVKQWLLSGQVHRQYRGGKSALTQLYLKSKDKTQQQPLALFLFSPKVNLKLMVKAGYDDYMKKSAKEKGQEVAERLQNLTNILWHWQGYQSHH